MAEANEFTMFWIFEVSKTFIIDEVIDVATAVTVVRMLIWYFNMIICQMRNQGFN